MTWGGSPSTLSTIPVGLTQPPFHPYQESLGGVTRGYSTIQNSRPSHRRVMVALVTISLGDSGKRVSYLIDVSPGVFPVGLSPLQ